MAVPDKFKRMADFSDYYYGRKKAPVLTIMIGGNHEASKYMEELHYGGWLAHNIYYLGRSGVVQYKGLRIGGMSGIYADYDYNKGYFEKPPYTPSTIRSVYHVREFDTFQLSQLSIINHKIDIFISHDWPQDIVHHGDLNGLLRNKPFFKEDIASGKLGSPPLKALLNLLQPAYWFAAHLHVKFAAIVNHKNTDSSNDKTEVTKFLALDKCVANKRYMQFLDIIPSFQEVGETIVGANGELIELSDLYPNDLLCYDLDWLAIVSTCRPYYPPYQFSKPHPVNIPQHELLKAKSTLVEQFKTTTFAIPSNFTLHGQYSAPSDNPQHAAFIKLLV